jgi:hemerythrin superfamily protein
MATRDKPTAKTRANQGGRTKASPAFSWDNKQAGVLATAAIAGAAVGFAANLGRKFLMQTMPMGAHGEDWDEFLAAEHRAVLACFDKIEATEDHQTTIRAYHLTKLKHALGKHALQEENVIYPALRDANNAHDADTLNSEHGYVKTYLYELENMAKDSTDWLAKVRDFRAMIEEHMKMEEEQVFPALKKGLSDEQNRHLAFAMRREGMKLA